MPYKLPSDKVDDLEGASECDNGIRGRLSKPASLDGGLASFDTPNSNTDNNGSSSVGEGFLPHPRSGPEKVHHLPSQEEPLKRPVSPATNLISNTSLAQDATPRDRSLPNDDHSSLVICLSRSDAVYNQESLYNSAIWGGTAAYQTNESADTPFRDTQNVIEHQPVSNVAHKSPVKQRTIPKNLDLISLAQSSESSDIGQSPVYDHLPQHQDLPSSATRYALNALDNSVKYSPTVPRQFGSNKASAGKEPQHTPSKVQLKQDDVPDTEEPIQENASAPAVQPGSVKQEKQDHVPDTEEPIQENASAPAVQPGSVKQEKQDNTPDTEEPTQENASAPTVEPGSVRRAMMAGLAMQPNPWYHKGGWARRPEFQHRSSNDSITFPPRRKQPAEKPARLTLDSEILNRPYPRRTGRPARRTFITDDAISRLRFAPISKQLIYDENLHPALRSHPYFNPMDRLVPGEPYKCPDPDRKYPELCRDNVVVQNLLCAKIRAMTVTPDVIPKPAPKTGSKAVLKRVSCLSCYGFPVAEWMGLANLLCLLRS